MSIDGSPLLILRGRIFNRCPSCKLVRVLVFGTDSDGFPLVHTFAHELASGQEHDINFALLDMVSVEKIVPCDMDGMIWEVRIAPQRGTAGP